MNKIHICNAMNEHAIEFLNKFIFCPYCGEALTEIAKEEKKEETKNTIIPNNDEIIRAHDVIELILLNKEIIISNDETRAVMNASLRVLCWILGHENGNLFIEDVVSTEAELAAQGIFFFDPRKVKEDIEQEIDNFMKENKKKDEEKE